MISLKKAIVSTLILSAIGAGTAQADNSSYLSDQSNSATQNNVQVNNSGTPTTTMGGIRCPTPSFTLGGAAINSDTIYTDRDIDSRSITVGVQIPWDLDGALSKCQQAQKDWIYHQKFNTQIQIVRACISAAKAGMVLDPNEFPWAKKCVGVRKYLAKRHNLKTYTPIAPVIPIKKASDKTTTGSENLKNYFKPAPNQHTQGGIPKR